MTERALSTAAAPGSSRLAGGEAPLRGQHAVVTGAGRGIGAAIARELGRLGANLTLMGRTAAPLLSTRDRLIAAHGREVAVVPVDVTAPAAVRAAFAEAAARWGPASVLVNNAGAAESAPFHETDPALWRRMLDVNLTAPYLCAREVLPAMVEAGYGRIVTIASTAGLVGYPYVAAYCAAKHGAVGLTRALAREVARTGVTVNAVCPGYTDTDLVARSIATIAARTGRSPEEARAALVRANPQGRLIEPAEVAQVVGWLCLPSSTAITGQAIAVAGGEVT